MPARFFKAILLKIQRPERLHQLGIVRVFGHRLFQFRHRRLCVAGLLEKISLLQVIFRRVVNLGYWRFDSPGFNGLIFNRLILFRVNHLQIMRRKLITGIELQQLLIRVDRPIHIPGFELAERQRVQGIHRHPVLRHHVILMPCLIVPALAHVQVRR